MKNLRALVIASASAMLLGLGAPAPAVSPVVFDVNTTKDGADFDLGDGHADADPVKPGDQVTLRAAIQNANLLGGPVQINLPAGKYKLSVKGNNEDACATGDLDITGNVTILGAGSAKTIIDAQNIDRVIDVQKLATATIADVTLTRGKTVAVTMNMGNQTVTFFPDGGGIRSLGALLMTRCTVSHCHASGGGGGVGLSAGLSEIPTSSLVDCYIVSNSAGYDGGGVECNQSSVTITGCTIAKNRADSHVVNDDGIDGEGGGIRCAAGFTGTTAATLLRVTNSTISGNKSTASGGGVTATLGALFTVEMVHCTVAYNSAKTAEGISLTGLGKMTIANCLLYKNDHNCTGPITSLGGNVELGQQCAFGAGDLNFANSKLGPLKMNGGPTPTHALKKGSAAIGAGNPSNCLPTDQRGQARKPACDSGAFETP